MGVMGSVLVTAALLIATGEPVLAEPTASLWQWGLTQGGVTVALLILAWSYRKDTHSIIASQSERLSVMADLVMASTAAQVKSADALDRMARAIELQENRRVSDRRTDGMAGGG